MSSVDVAEGYARLLVDRERITAGNTENAMRRVGEKTGAGYWTIWALWNRRRKTVGADLVTGLRKAVIRRLEAEVRHLEQELAILRATDVDADPLQIASVVADLAKVRRSLGIEE